MLAKGAGTTGQPEQVKKLTFIFKKSLQEQLLVKICKAFASIEVKKAKEMLGYKENEDAAMKTALEAKGI